MRVVFSTVFLLFILNAHSQDAPEVTEQEKQTKLAAVKQWRGFDGTWEGELRYIAAPKDEWYKQRTPFKIEIKNNEPKAYVRRGVRNWSELATVYRLHQPDPLTLVVHAYAANGVWTENNVIVLTRRSENQAEVFMQRVVNNWAGKTEPGEDLVFGDTRSGKLERR